MKHTDMFHPTPREDRSESVKSDQTLGQRPLNQDLNISTWVKPSHTCPQGTTTPEYPVHSQAPLESHSGPHWPQIGRDERASNNSRLNRTEADVHSPDKAA